MSNLSNILQNLVALINSRIWRVFNVYLYGDNKYMAQVMINDSNYLDGLRFTLTNNYEEAEILILTCALSHKSAHRLLNMISKMPGYLMVISLSAEASGGGALHFSYACLKSCAQVIRVDAYIPHFYPGSGILSKAISLLCAKDTKNIPA